ncbi:MAG: hypothetical protein ABL971_01960 [Vicinamibacterales bacterium]
MTRRLAIAALAALCIVPLAAQGTKGWRVRADRSTSASDPDGAGAIQFMAMGGGFHAVNPQAAVYWNPANTATGSYTLKGSFKLMKPSGHTNFYGLVFGGADLDGPKQAYTYFLVGQDGSWVLKTRNGDEVVRGSNPADVAPKGTNAAVAKPGADGTSVNNLEVRVQADKVDYVVNGAVVHSTPKSAVRTDGVYGFRVNHQLEVMVEGLAVSK